ncbi:MAG: biopolymer transporter ExbD [Prevotella sp.]|nr:biopolymer transporter ExbD [Prevotella sp.]
MRNRYFERNGSDREVPGLNMASLPDLIFTVLFFFMIVTHMRDVTLKVHYEVPQGTELQKMRHKGSVVSIYVGREQTANGSGDFCIQLNNEVATIDDIKSFVEEERLRMSSEDQARMTVSIKADKDAPMGLIADIKQALQQSYALKINYSATEKKDIINN